MATVYLRGKTWWARWYRPGGKRTQESTGVTGKREAQRIAAELEAADRRAQEDPRANAKQYQAILAAAAKDARAGRLDRERAHQHFLDLRRVSDPDFLVITLEAQLREWTAGQESRVTDSTFATYRNALHHWLRVLPRPVLAAPVGDLTPPQVEAALQKLAKTKKRGGAKIRAATVNQCLGILRRVLQYAVDSGHARGNPAGSIRPLPQIDSTERAPFTVTEVRAMIDHRETSQEWQGAILLGAHTGLRLSDVVSLGPSHLHGAELVLRPKKTARTRKVLRIPLTPPCLAWIAQRKGRWFPTLHRIATGTLSTQFSRIMERAGVPRIITLPGDLEAARSFHCLRHTFVSWLAEADIHADVRRQLAGHSDAGIHALYTHRDASLARAIEVLPDLHAAAGKPAMETRRRRRS